MHGQNKARPDAATAWLGEAERHSAKEVHGVEQQSTQSNGEARTGGAKCGNGETAQAPQRHTEAGQGTAAAISD
jgi:hypothetical protein